MEKKQTVIDEFINKYIPECREEIRNEFREKHKQELVDLTNFICPNDDDNEEYVNKYYTNTYK